MSGADPHVLEAVGRCLRSAFFERIDELSCLQAENWHGDRLFRFSADGRAHLARLIASPRVYRTSPRFEYDSALLDAQLAVCAEFVRSGLPYMRPASRLDNGALRADVPLASGDGHLAVFEWAEGQALSRVDPVQAGSIGHWLGRSHLVFENRNWPTSALPCSHDFELHARWCADIRELVLGDAETAALLGEHIGACERRIDALRSALDTPRLVVHGDFNLPNVLWADAGRNFGTVVDFDQIGLSRAIEDLAWVVKWYGLRGASPDPFDHLVPLIASYAAQRPIAAREWRCLPELLWLAGGMNYNFVLKVARAIDQPRIQRNHSLRALQRDYRERSERLEAIGTELVRRCGPDPGGGARAVAAARHPSKGVES
jgi:Ser/Thr protein kinase RdoA (MazF antagonist)